jgi:hypothetical protein
MGFFPYMGEILWVFLTFMEVFPIPPLSRGRSGGGWGIYVAVVLEERRIQNNKNISHESSCGCSKFQPLLQSQMTWQKNMKSGRPG